MEPDKKENLKKPAKNVTRLTRVKNHDKVVVITDHATRDIGHHVHDAAAELATAKLILIEDHATRPAVDLPQSLISEINEFAPTVSVYAASVHPGELPVFRRPLLDLLTKEHGARHAHMVNITEELMLTGMVSDYDQIATITTKLQGLLESCSTVRVTSPDGTNITAIINNEKYRWVPCTGVIESAEHWTNLPDGEIFTFPESVNGVIAARVVGDYIGQKYGVLDEPMLVTIKDSYITNVSHPNEALVQEFTDYINESPMNDRVGEFAIGTNAGLQELTGNLLQDEKFPGLHIAFGHPYPDKTGADWDAPGHIDLVSPGASIWVDDRQVMKDGKFQI